MRFELEYEHVLLVYTLKVNKHMTLWLQNKLKRITLLKLLADNFQILRFPL